MTADIIDINSWRSGATDALSDTTIAPAKLSFIDSIKEGLNNKNENSLIFHACGDKLRTLLAIIVATDDNMTTGIASITHRDRKADERFDLPANFPQNGLYLGGLTTHEYKEDGALRITELSTINPDSCKISAEETRRREFYIIKVDYQGKPYSHNYITADRANEITNEFINRLNLTTEALSTFSISELVRTKKFLERESQFVGDDIMSPHNFLLVHGLRPQEAYFARDYLLEHLTEAAAKKFEALVEQVRICKPELLTKLADELDLFKSTYLKTTLENSKYANIGILKKLLSATSITPCDVAGKLLRQAYGSENSTAYKAKRALSIGKLLEETDLTKDQKFLKDL